jgi:hypothetical protein
VFYRLLRPEFLNIRKLQGFPAISPDSCSRWSDKQVDQMIHNGNLRAATCALLTEHVPLFAHELARMPVAQLALLHIAQESHRRGINLRHLGLVRRLLLDGAPSASAPASATRESSLPTPELAEKPKLLRQASTLSSAPDASRAEAAGLLLVEIVSRTLKNILRSWLRDAVEATKATGEFVYREIVVGFLNLASGAAPRADSFWQQYVYVGVCDRFGACSLDAHEAADLLAAVRPRLAPLLRHLMDMTGLSLAPQADGAFSKAFGAAADNAEPKFEFTSIDLNHMAVKVKHMSVMDAARARVRVQAFWRTYTLTRIYIYIYIYYFYSLMAASNNGRLLVANDPVLLCVSDRHPVPCPLTRPVYYPY